MMLRELQHMLLAVLVTLAPAMQAAAQVSFSGIVRDGISGTPVEGASMSLYKPSTPWNGETLDETVSAADGSYTLSSPSADSNLQLFTSHPDYADSALFIEHASGSTVVQDIDLFPVGDGTLEVVVTNAASGAPLSGIRINVARDSLVATPVTDANGRVTLTLPSERYAICASDYDGGTYFGQCFDGLPSPPASLFDAPKQLLAPGQLLSLQIALHEGSLVTGVVRDRQTGAPLANRAVSARFTPSTGGSSIVQPTTLDDDGRYRISTIPDGSYRVSMSLGSQTAVPYYDTRRYPDVACHGSCPSDAGDVVEVSSTAALELDFDLGPAAGIAGTVVAADGGGPLAGVELIAFRQITLFDDWSPIHRTTTAADGRYVLDYLPTGTIRLATANTAGYQNQRWPGDPCLQADCDDGQGISLGGGLAAAPYDFTLQREPAISGSVISLWTTRSLPARIDIADAAGSVVWTATYPATEVYTTAGLPAGTYHARAIGLGAEPPCQLHEAIDCVIPTDAAAFTAAMPIVIGDADVTGIDFALDDRIVFANGFD